jgi:transcriptional regulator with XRE-family HTH domain
MVNITGAQCAALRARHKINQQDFWSTVGVTQSGGSRYESGRPIPKPTQLVISLVFGIGGAERLRRNLEQRAKLLLR